MFFMPKSACVLKIGLMPFIVSPSSIWHDIQSRWQIVLGSHDRNIMFDEKYCFMQI